MEEYNNVMGGFLRILKLVSSLGIGGAEKFVTDLAIELSANGNKVSVLVLDSASNVGKDTCYEQRLLNELSSRGIDVYFVGGKGRKNPLRVLLSLFKTLILTKPTIVHSHLLIWSLYLSIFKPFCKFNHVFTQHIHYLKYPKLHKYFLRFNIDVYAAICEQVKIDILFHIPTANVRKVVNGIDVDRFIGDNFSVREYNGTLRFITISRLTSQKNHKLLIDALASFRETHPEANNFHLSIVGDGPLKSELVNYVDERSLSEYVSFLGTRSDIFELLREHDLFLLPSLYEGFSIALIEAVCSGIHIIASDVGGNSEIVSDSSLGVLVESGDVNILRSAISDFYFGRPSFTNQKVIEKYAESLSITKCALHHERLYRVAYEC